MALKRELRRLEEADGTVLYAFGLSKVIPADCKRNWVVRTSRKLLLGSFTFLERNLGSVPYEDFHVPRDAFIELGSIHEV